MKKFQFLALMGAAALTGASLFSCSNDEELAEVNPNYNPATGEVTTQFVMNVNTNMGSTRMSSANTQATSSDAFRGINDAHLLSFLRSTPAADGGHITSSATAANKHYGLGNVYTTSQATTDGATSHRILELALPTETNVLMFYGKAPKTVSDGFAQGNIDFLPEVDATNNTDLTKYNFAVKQIVETNTFGYNEKYRQYGDLLTAALNWVLATKYDTEAAIAPATSADGKVQYDADGNGTVESSEQYSTTLSWFQFVTVTGAVASGVTVAPATKNPIDGAQMSAMGEILAKTLTEICTVNSGEVRAGSGPAVARMLGDVWVTMNKIATTAPTSLREAQVRALATKIRNNIGNLMEGTAPSFTWKQYANVVSAIGYTGDVSQLGGAGGLTALQAYPMEAFNLPAGCTQIGISEITTSTAEAGKVTSPGSVKFNHIGNVSLFSTVGSTSCYNVFYPAEICYYGNSPIRVTNESVVESEYPQGIANWMDDTKWVPKNWTKNSHVVSTTRSVAMQYNINYGTALLKSQVKYGATTLKDNNHAIQKIKNPSLSDTQTTAGTYDDEPDALITVTESSFTLSGILVGGMPTKVGWDFLPLSGETFKNAIYDKSLAPAVGSTPGADKIPTSGTSTPNYTLVWDNWNAAQKGNAQNSVYVCLEFVNNTGKDFWGQHNIIRAGGTFYIIGKLDPDVTSAATLSALGVDADGFKADKSLGITWPTDVCLPPHDTDGTTIKERRVFIQDFMTEATFVIGETSLQHAYNTVPDLRSTQISLGLSVDLKWQNGLKFEDIVLGQ